MNAVGPVLSNISFSEKKEKLKMGILWLEAEYVCLCENVILGSCCDWFISFHG